MSFALTGKEVTCVDCGNKVDPAESVLTPSGNRICDACDIKRVFADQGVEKSREVKT